MRVKTITTTRPFNVITFSAQFYSYVDVLAKRLLDIVGSLVGLVICGVAGVFLYPLIRKTEDQLSLYRIVLDRMDVFLDFINSAQCVLMLRKLKAIDG